MNIAILTNFLYPGVGGSEIVIKNIAERLSVCNNITCFGFNIKHSFIKNNVKYKKYNNKFNINLINKFDHIFIYGDVFWGFKKILNNINYIKPKISIALVGMNFLRNNNKYFQIFKKNSNKFNIIVHSDKYIDYKFCVDNDLSAFVIPNGVNFNLNNQIDIRKKFNIKTKYILLNVSNFFKGKGQEYLLDIANKINDYIGNDFTLLQISHNFNNYNFENKNYKRIKNKIIKGNNNKFKCVFLRDISRDIIISSFAYSDVFVFTSLKEVAPLVIIEAMVYNCPWISMDVGNVEELKNGIIIKNKETDNLGNKIINKMIVDKYAYNVNEVLKDRKKYLNFDKLSLNKKYNWDIICKKYYNVFNVI